MIQSITKINAAIPLIHHLILLAKVLSPKKMYEKQIQAALIHPRGNRLYRAKTERDGRIINRF